jgi:hypothetical protein
VRGASGRRFDFEMGEEESRFYWTGSGGRVTVFGSLFLGVLGRDRVLDWDWDWYGSDWDGIGTGDDWTGSDALRYEDNMAACD